MYLVQKNAFVAGIALFLVGLAEACDVDGTIRKNGETWLVKNVFLMRCNIEASGSWSTEILECRTPVGTRIEPGQTATDTLGTFECAETDGGMIRLELISPVVKEAVLERDGPSLDTDSSNDTQQEQGVVRKLRTRAARNAVCSIDGQLRQNGQTWRTGRFKMECEARDDGSWQTRVIGCYTPENEELILDQSVIMGTTRFSCTRSGTSGAVFKSQTVNNIRCETATGNAQQNEQQHKTIQCQTICVCTHNGQIRKQGEIWQSGDYTLKCVVNKEDGSWQSAVQSCQTPGGFNLAVGKSRVEGDQKYTCARTGTTGARLEKERITIGVKGSSGDGTLLQKLVQCRTMCVCVTEGRIRQAGETWRDGEFQMKCVVNKESGSWHTEITSCYTPDNNRIAVGETRMENDRKFICTEQGRRSKTALKTGTDGTDEVTAADDAYEASVDKPAAVKPVSTEPDDVSGYPVGPKLDPDRDSGEREAGKSPVMECARCVAPVDGRRRNHGDTWREGDHKMKCMINERECTWKNVVETCFTPKQRELAIGESGTEGNRKYTCTKTGIESETVRGLTGQEADETKLTGYESSNEVVVDESAPTKSATDTDVGPPGFGPESDQSGYSVEPPKTYENSEKEEKQETGACAKCIATVDGRAREHGETWREGGYVMKCLINERECTWKNVVETCFTPKNRQLTVGESGREGDRKFTCTQKGIQSETVSSAVGKYGSPRDPVKYKKEHKITRCLYECTCKVDGGPKRHGETWRDNSYIMRCVVNEPANSWRTEVAACFTPNDYRIPLGDSHTERNLVFTCEPFGITSKLLGYHRF